jgi:hypothetical protein
MLVLCSGERVTTVLPIDLDPSSAGVETVAPRAQTLSGGGGA